MSFAIGCSFIMRGQPEAVLKCLEQAVLPGHRIVVSTITYFEMRFCATDPKASTLHVHPVWRRAPNWMLFCPRTALQLMEPGILKSRCVSPGCRLARTILQLPSSSSPPVRCVRRHLCSKMERAESAIIITDPANIRVSFNTNLPAPDKYGKPWCKSPKSGTQASGVVLKNDRVTRGVRNDKVPPINPIQRLKGLARTKRAIRTSTTLVRL